MKRVLLVVLSSAALSCWGQTAPAPAKAAPSGSRSSTAAVIQAVDGSSHTLELPGGFDRLQSFLAQQEDLESWIGSQGGCPVQIVHASFDRPAQLVLTAQGRDDGAPMLRLNYLNFSGKDIESVLLTGWIKVKESRYQLDASVHPFALTLSRRSLLGKDTEATQALRLAANAIGFDRIELTQVTYADGKTWTPERRNCVYANLGASENAKAW